MAERVQAPPEPDWRPLSGAADLPDTSTGAPQEHSAESGPILYDSRDVDALKQQVAAACGDSDQRQGRNFLRSLVADLYFSEVDPASATEALLLGQCGKDTDILAEMVAQGGDRSLDPVMARALQIKGQGARSRIARAAETGLTHQAERAEAVRNPSGEDLSAYGMLYFPSSGEGRKLDVSIALNQLYDEAVPGYGIYTFVLFGHSVGKLAGADAVRYREFFRVLETYVSTLEDDRGAPSVEAHAFLVPVKRTGEGGGLMDLAATDLSDAMRRDVRRDLRRAGQQALASRLDSGAGPFLIATLDPRLSASSADAPRLFADLSTIGPEYIYGVVDAYDLPIPPELGGRPESLSLIRERLQRLPVKPDADAGPPAQADKTWVFMLGRFARADAPRRATRFERGPARPTLASEHLISVYSRFS